MSNFKLIGIRPHKNCGEKFLKVLEPGRLYQFYNEYEFYTKDGKFDGINGEITHYVFNKSAPVDLYKVGKLDINVSAVVGMNGSGKSTLLDLIYLSSFLIAKEFDLLEKFKALDNKKNPEQIIDKSLFIHGNELMDINNSLFYELYYDLGGDLYRLMNNDTDGISLSYQKLGSIKWTPVKYLKTKADKFLHKFFYSIATNYSIYGFNETTSPWIGHLLHKNDGYKTPTVINPYRKNGVIYINTENHLAQVRTLTSLADSTEQFPTLVNKKKLASVDFVLDLFENNFISNRHKIEFEFHTVMNSPKNPIKLELFELFNQVSVALCGLSISDPVVLKGLKQERENDLKVDVKDKYDIHNYVDLAPSKLNYEIIKYSIRKLYKICANHFDDFSDFISQENLTSPTYIKDLNGLLERLKKDKSHVSLKLRQSLYLFHSNFFKGKKWHQIGYYRDPLNKYSYSFTMPWNDLKQKIKKLERKYGKSLDERMEIIPAAFVKPKIFIQNPNREDESSMLELSSGELQLTNSIQTIIYHVYNINSVHKIRNLKGKIKYEYVNIILDEVELYFHPEFQRNFVNELIAALNRTKTDFIKGINIIFSTHSPFILSDIPEQNILKLEFDKQIKYSVPKPMERQTFGANIHDLLASSFFLENGSMGAYAKTFVESIYEQINGQEINENSASILSKKIELIGEDLIKERLEFILSQKLNQRTKDQIIEDLRNELIRLRDEKN